MPLKARSGRWAPQPVLAQRLAFFRFDNSFGIIKGEQPLIRASRASKVAGTFLVLFWCAKENLAQRKSALTPRTGARCRQSVTTIISAFSSMEQFAKYPSSSGIHRSTKFEYRSPSRLRSRRACSSGEQVTNILIS